jgi:hypothetical protein
MPSISGQLVGPAHRRSGSSAGAGGGERTRVHRGRPGCPASSDGLSPSAVCAPVRRRCGFRYGARTPGPSRSGLAAALACGSTSARPAADGLRQHTERLSAIRSARRTTMTLTYLSSICEPGADHLVMATLELVSNSGKTGLQLDVVNTNSCRSSCGRCCPLLALALLPLSHVACCGSLWARHTV